MPETSFRNETGEIKTESQRETKIKPSLSIRIPEDWMEQIVEIAEKTGRSKTDVGTEAIAKYLGKEHKFVVDELHEATATITQLRQQNLLLFRQTKHLNARLQRIEALFKQTAG
jgi:predicted transcriptional regulator